MSETHEYHGLNAGYIEELYERYRQDPALVDAETRAYFDAGHRPATDVRADVPRADIGASSDPTNVVTITEHELAKVVSAARLGRIIRELGHLDAHLDPLGSAPPGDPALLLETHHLTTEDLARLPASVIGGPLSQGAANALEAVARLRKAYSGSIGYEDDHVQVAEEREWLRSSVESGVFFHDLDAEEKKHILRQLTDVDTFEQFLHRTAPYAGQKRFSIEGCDMMVPMLDAIIRCAAQAGTREVVMGMAHRGRLNVLAHILGKPYDAMLAEFGASSSKTAQPAVAGTGAQGYTGDVKYHKGYRRAYALNGPNGPNGSTMPVGHGRGHRSEPTEMPITLAPNPSHLEFVSPAVLGRARAAQERTAGAGGKPPHDRRASLAILIHGDAAFPGQGVVAETLNLGQLYGYTVGGTIHIIANNQLGFTTLPRDGRSTLYASDLAKGFEMPIVHVNADDPIACIAVARMACAYRDRFGKDFLIDLIGYRRLGHNEGEEPAFTQPRMYEKIRSHPRVREIWAKKLEQEHIVSRDEADALVKAVQTRLMEAKNNPPVTSDSHSNKPDVTHDTGEIPGPQPVSVETLSKINHTLVTAPEGFNVDSKIARNFLKPRRDAFEADESAINWAHAEALAFGATLLEGTPIRLTGQDTERGTFTQRHLILHDPTTGEPYCSLQNLPGAKATFAVYNSPLSEAATLGFEYGYSIHAINTLVLWEAQFGDFVNGAQVIIDQFISSGNAKWGQSPSVVLLLPHGYEGQGPEHSSARLERFLELCAGDNMRVAYCSTPAQYFHILRRQAASLAVEPRPLILMTPKSLLRHPRVHSSVRELAEGSFRPVLDDPRAPDRKPGVTRLILCSGKVFYDLTLKSPEEKFADRDEYVNESRIALARVEELNPFPAEELKALLASYPHLTEVVWVQEEPHNMGAWGFMSSRLTELLPSGVSLRYVGRPDAASPAEGSNSRHLREQARIVAEAYAFSETATGAGKNGKGRVSRNGDAAFSAQDAPEPESQQVSEPARHK
ncbi:MAG: 2-oxoglutarate dehydrogenase E1 component [Capsulimonadales bacterium]|nr:2-oxoglutarate dehydrogenase E1 component [Capsulimonadales bacterium]